MRKAWSNFWDDTEGDGYSQVDINVNHPMKLSRIAIRALLGKNKKGVILITASLAGFQVGDRGATRILSECSICLRQKNVLYFIGNPCLKALVPSH